MKAFNLLLGSRIKEVRQSRKWSQERLSERVGVESKYLSRIEVGKATPSLATLVKIAGELGVEVKDLFEFSHLSPSENNVEKILEGVSEDQRKLIIKLIKAVIY